ncbi:XdhC family protein [Coralliovum pocilloporae]|uniref:XdhC family protein n=1 Tax=Coralliovum pocilloporae TaxID=3066369 RepID=UPI003306EB60
MSVSAELIRELNEARARREPIALVSRPDGGAASLVRPGEDIGLAESALDGFFRSGKSGLADLAGGEQVFLAVHVPAPRLVLIGAVHISQALAPMARIAGLDVTIIDPRTAFATEDRFEGFPLYADWPDEVLPGLGLDPYTALAAVTHDPKIDDMPLMAALEANCFYVGALGSRKTHGKRQIRMEEAGVSEDAFSRIHAPIGLDIGASNPSEIAVSVLAEVILRLRGAKSEKGQGI